MSQTIQVKRGLKVNLPILALGEFGFCTDTKGIYIGDGVANVLTGNMLKTIYDTTNNGIVDNAEKLGGKSPTEFILANEKGVAGGVALFDSVASSLADNSTQHGNLALLNTTNKSSLVNAVNELFTSVDNGKNSVYSAIVGKNSTPASKDFADLVTGINNISSSNTKSIQRGIATINSALIVNVTIASVDITKSIVLIDYSFTGGSQDNSKNSLVKAKLTTGANIELSVQGYTSGPVLTISYTVIEFNNVKSLQTGLFNVVSDGVEHTVTVSAINVSKSILFKSFSSNNANVSASEMILRTRIIDTTTLGFYQKDNVGGYTLKTEWQLIEFN